MKLAIRNSLATLFRAFPYFRGKYKLGPALIPLLTNYEVEQDCFVTFQMRDGSTMRLDLRSFTEQRAFFCGEYDGGIIQRLSSILKRGSTVFDVGANVGFYSMALGHKLKKLSGSSKLWAFEPVKSNFDRLVSLVELNELQTIIYPVNKALGNQEGEIQLNMVDKINLSTTGNAVWVKGSMAEKIPSNCLSEIMSLDIFTKQNNIKCCDLIKVDIEGAELDSLLGGTNFITECRPIIYGEFNPYWTKEFGYSFVDVADLVIPWGYNLYEQKGRKNFVEIKEPKVGIADVLMVPQGTSSSLLAKLGIVQ